LETSQDILFFKKVLDVSVECRKTRQVVVSAGQVRPMSQILYKVRHTLVVSHNMSYYNNLTIF